MSRFRWLITLCLAVLPWPIPSLLAQQNAPHLAYALPAGGMRGTTLRVKIGGQFLPNANRVHLSGGGIQARVVDYARPMTAMQATQLRERMRELMKQPRSAAIDEELIAIRTKLLIFGSTRNISPVLAETITLEIQIDAGTEIGKRELRREKPRRRKRGEINGAPHLQHCRPSPSRSFPNDGTPLLLTTDYTDCTDMGEFKYAKLQWKRVVW